MVGRFRPDGGSVNRTGATHHVRFGALLAGLGVAIVLLTACTVTIGRLLVTPVGGGIAQPFDDAIRSWTQTHLTAWHPIAEALATIGSTLVIAALSVALTAYLWRRTHDAPRALLPLASVVIAAAVGTITKILVARVRPGGAEVGLLEVYSFPSGHTEAAAALAIGTYLAWRTGRTLYATRFAAAAVVITIVAVAVARVVLDVHWTTDVIAGAGVGAASALAARWALQRAKPTSTAETATISVEPCAAANLGPPGGSPDGSSRPTAPSIGT